MADSSLSTMKQTDPGPDALEVRLLTLDLVDKLPPSLPRGSRWKEHCTVRMVGRTMDHQVVSIWARGWHPYFFLELPPGWHDTQLSDLREYILRNVRSMEENLGKFLVELFVSEAQQAHEKVDCKLQRSHRTFGFSDGKLFPFVKLSFRSNRTMHQCKRLFEDEHVKLSEDDESKVYKVCEVQSIPTVLKSLHDTNIQPSGWVRVRRYQKVNGEADTDLNLHVQYTDIEPFESDEIPRLVEMSFDGEMVSEHYIFPQANKPHDAITQLGVQFCYSGGLGQESGRGVAYHKVLFCLDRMGDLSDDGVEVRCSESEVDLLWDWRAHMLKHNPDIITGYNIVRFDIPYIIKRAKHLKMPREFFVWGRFNDEPTELIVSFKCRQNPELKVQYDVPIVGGRRLEDCYNSVKGLQKQLTSYTLDYVANFYLKVGKHDVEPEDIFRAYQDTTDMASAQRQMPAIQALLTQLRVVQAMLHYTVSRATQNEPLSDLPSGKLSPDELLERVKVKWPTAYHDQISHVGRHALFHTLGKEATMDTMWSTSADVVAFVDAYVRQIKHGSTLSFDEALIDLNAPWMDTHTLVPSPTKKPSSSSLTTANVAKSTEAPPEIKRLAGAKRDRTADAASSGGMENFVGMADTVGPFPDECMTSNSLSRLLKHWELRVAAEVDVLSKVLECRVTRKFAQKWWHFYGSSGPCIQTVDEAEFDRLVSKHTQFNLDEKTRIGRYCMQDAALPLQLREKHQFLISLMEMSMVTHVPCNMLLEKGQTIKVINLAVLWARHNNYVMTVVALPEVYFKGASVLFPKKGFHRRHVFTLDFSSLYPSLIQSNQLCYLSLILPEDKKRQTYANRPDLEIVDIDIGEPSNQVYSWVVNRPTCLPVILRSLVGRRSEVKEELEKETDGQRRIILNQRQLALKLVGNSTYGFCGWKFSPWPCLPIAVCTTVRGREAIATAKRIAETEFGAEVIYGDSVTADTPVLIRRNYVDHMGVHIVTRPRYVAIESLPIQGEWPDVGGNDGSVKQRATPAVGLEIWSDQGFTLLRQVIRHSTTKQLYRVTTPTGTVKVTEDHSLLRPNGTEVSPKNLSVGTPLMHSLSMPSLMPPMRNDDLCEDAECMFVVETEVVVDSELEAARVFYRMEQAGYYPTIRVLNDSPTLKVRFRIAPGYMTPLSPNMTCDWDQRIVSIDRLENPAKTSVYVYDVETANHHFAAGVGKMVVHNTDSIMAMIDIPRHITSDVDKLEYVFKVAHEAADRITAQFTKPMKLLFEKVYYPYLLMNKKRYSGLKWTRSDKTDGVDTKGVEAIRRDNCPILRNTVTKALEILGEGSFRTAPSNPLLLYLTYSSQVVHLARSAEDTNEKGLAYQQDIGKAIDFCITAFQSIANQDVSWADLIISKKLGESYKDDKHIHVRVAQYLEKHNPLLAPEPGDRVPYVVIKRPGEDRNTKGYEKGANPILAEREGMEVDWDHYCFKGVKPPIDRIFCTALGLNYKKGKRVQESDYLWEPYLQRIVDNDYQQMARLNGQGNLDGFVKRTRRDGQPGTLDDHNDATLDNGSVKLQTMEEQRRATAAALAAVKRVRSGDIRSMFQALSKK